MGKAPIGRTTDSVLVVEHEGGIDGFSSIISRVMPKKDLVVLLSNVGRTRVDDITRAIRGILFDKPYDMPRKSVADTVLATIMEKGISSGLQLYRVLKGEHSDVYAVREEEMNSAGYRLLSAGKLNEAIEIFKLNVGDFQESYNAYDSLGEAYMAMGEKNLAIKNYKRSVELNPTSVSGIAALKKLEAQ